MSEDRTKEIAQIVTELVTNAMTRIMPVMEARSRRPPGYQCTGKSFGCDTVYICDNNNHSCRVESSFSCGGDFSCTLGAFGIVVEVAR